MWSIVAKEYRQRARGVATVGLIITYTLILGGIAYFTYLAQYALLLAPGSGTTTGQVGHAMCVAIFIAQLIMALMLSLSLNASSIAAEKDQETFDLLNLTLFKSWEIVLGKFFSSTGFLLVLVITAVPIYTLAFTFGSVSLDFFWQLAAVVVGSTALISAIGLLMSLTSEDLRSALGRAFLAMIVLGVVTGLFGGFLSGSLSIKPPNLITYWLGALSWLLNPLWPAIDMLGTPFSAKLAWTSPQPHAVPFLVNHLWACAALFQLLCTAAILAATARIYPRYRASRSGGVG